MSSKINVIERLEFELAYYDAAFYHITHYATKTPQLLYDTKFSYLIQIIFKQIYLTHR